MIAAQSLRSRFPIAAQSLRSPLAITAQSLRSRFAIAAQSPRNRFSCDRKANTQRLQYNFANDCDAIITRIESIKIAKRTSDS
jgi:hypothetical protein